MIAVTPAVKLPPIFYGAGACDLRIFPRIFEKNQNVAIGIMWAPGKDDSGKNLK
jgi:hypothetical protein